MLLFNLTYRWCCNCFSPKRISNPFPVIRLVKSLWMPCCSAHCKPNNDVVIDASLGGRRRLLAPSLLVRMRAPNLVPPIWSLSSCAFSPPCPCNSKMGRCSMTSFWLSSAPLQSKHDIRYVRSACTSLAGTLANLSWNRMKEWIFQFALKIYSP